MQSAGDQQFNELKLKFINLDDDLDGFINKSQLQSFMKAQKLFKVPVWKVNQVMNELQNKMNEEDFIIWIMGCRMGLQDLAQTKFRFTKNIKKFNSAGPSNTNPSVKKSYLDIKINKEQHQIKYPSTDHFLNLKVGIDKQGEDNKRKQLSQVLGRNPSDVFFLFKLKTIAKGDQIAQKLYQIAQFGMALGSQFGPTVTPLLESLTITSKWANEYVYLVIEVNNSFLNVLLKFLNEAIQQLTPEGKCLLEAKISSDFSKVLKSNFNPLSQSLSFNAELQIGGISLSKINQKMIEDFGTLSSDQKANFLLLFLLEQVNLALSFSNLKQCFQSFGLKQVDIPKPITIGGQIKNYQIKEMISQVVPEGNQLIGSIQQYCTPEGQISLNVSNITIELSYNFHIQEAFALL